MFEIDFLIRRRILLINRIFLLFTSIPQNKTIQFLKIFFYFFLQFNISYLQWNAISFHNRNTLSLHNSRMEILIINVFV